jgi:hypothetical protein
VTIFFDGSLGQVWIGAGTVLREDEVDMLAAADDLLEASGSAAKGGQPTRQPKSTLTNPLGDEDPATQREALVNSMLGKAAT